MTLTRRWNIVVSVALLTAATATAAEEELIWQDGQWVRQPAPQVGTPAGEVAIIRRCLDEQRYPDALAAAKAFLKRYPSDPLREEVLGAAGTAELRRGRYWQAYGWFEKQLAEFPRGPRMEQALTREMDVAEAFLAGKRRIVWGIFRLRAREEGVGILEKIAEHAPGSLHAEAALLRVGEYRFSQGRWEDAASAYDSFLLLFPKSPRSRYAHLRAAESFWRSYRGPLFDQAPLLEAQQRYGAIRANYPAAAAEANVEGVLRQLDAARARKDYEIARFYERTDKPAAAAYYYELVVREHAESVWAGRAREALEKLPANARQQAQALGSPDAAPPRPAEAG